MSKFKVLFLALVSSAVLNAGGIGVYLPYNQGISKDMSYDDNDVGEYDLETGQTGIGFALATNLGKEEKSGYKFAIEITNPNYDKFDRESDKYEMLHTFETGLINNRLVKLWVGPRINIGYETFENKYIGGKYEENGFEVGIAPAIGVNINLGSYLAFTFDIDYKFAWQGGSWEEFGTDYYGDYTSIADGSYSHTLSGPSVRFGVFLKFNEEFDSFVLE